MLNQMLRWASLSWLLADQAAAIRPSANRVSETSAGFCVVGKSVVEKKAGCTDGAAAGGGRKAGGEGFGMRQKAPARAQLNRPAANQRGTPGRSLVAFRVSGEGRGHLGHGENMEMDSNRAESPPAAWACTP